MEKNVASIRSRANSASHISRVKVLFSVHVTALAVWQFPSLFTAQAHPCKGYAFSDIILPSIPTHSHLQRQTMRGPAQPYIHSRVLPLWADEDSIWIVWGMSTRCLTF